MYRLAADVFNDAAMILDCLSPALPRGPRVVLLSFSSVLRALCGVAAGSSKASLSAHFAKWGNLGELNAVSDHIIADFSPSVCFWYGSPGVRLPCAAMANLQLPFIFVSSLSSLERAVDVFRTKVPKAKSIQRVNDMAMGSQSIVSPSNRVKIDRRVPSCASLRGVKAARSISPISSRPKDVLSLSVSVTRSSNIGSSLLHFDKWSPIICIKCAFTRAIY